MLRRIRNLLTRVPRARRDKEAVAAEAPAAPAPPAETARPPDGAGERVIVRHGPRVVHHPIDPSQLDPDAVRILQRLTRFNYTAYLVGGCVRDMLLNRRPKDFDIGTSATPRQVKRLFSNCRIIGRRFRLAHVYFQSGKIIEVATFRAYDAEEGEDATAAARKDLLIREDNVFGDPEEDALRRDFTINALFYDANSQNVLDHADGLSDLRRRLVRTIGDPEIRFREDPIRILRAIKFAARLDFEIEQGTLEALGRTRVEIPRAAMPRVLEEINRFCRGGAAHASFALAIRTGVFEVILPELDSRYRHDDDARDLMLAWMDTVDRRLAQGHEASTGEILAVLALPLLAEQLGWGWDGTATPAHDTSPRDAADELLRPLALRLRVSRRDQERCRQIVQTIARMVPVRSLRRGARHAIAHRPAFPDALWILDALGARLGGDFSEAAAFWRTGAPLPHAEPRRAAHDGHGAKPDEPGTEGAPAERKRRRRRRSRRRREGGEARPPGEAGVAPQAAAGPHRAHPQRPAKPRELPSPWDDDYFFAALPTAPALEAEEGDTDRYGAAAVSRALEPHAEAPNEAEARRPAGAESAGPDGAPARKRRRRRRSRRGKPPEGGGPTTP